MLNMLENIEMKFAGVNLNEKPFEHFSFNSVLTIDGAASLLHWFETVDLWSFTETNFYTQYEFSLQDLELPNSLKFLNSEDTRNYLAEHFKSLFGRSLQVTEITAHKLVHGYRMGVHNDFIGKAETHRLVIQINNSWTDDNGGYLMLFNSQETTDVAKVIRPLHNTGIGFEISPSSFHAVSTVHNFTRYTLVYTFNDAF